MDNKEYTHQDSAHRHGHGPMGHGPMGHGPGAHGHEKAKNLVGTWKKLFGYCNKYTAAIAVALICAVLGTVLTLIGPDKLSDMTDAITSGLLPNTAILEEISHKMADNTASNLKTVIGGISANISDKSKLSQNAQKVLSSADISNEDKAYFQKAMTAANATYDPELLSSLPGSVLDVLFDRVEINGSVISGKDQVAAMQLISGADGEDNNTMRGVPDRLPDSVAAALYTDINVGKAVIPAKDQRETTAVLADIDAGDKNSAIAAMDRLPDSVYDLIKPSINLDKVFTIAMTLVVMYALSWLFSAVQGWTMATVTQRVSKQMRSDISKKINRLPMYFYNKTSTGDILSRVTNDVDTIGQSLNQSLGNLVHSIVLFVGSLIMMLITDGWMTLTAVVASLLGFVLMFSIMGRSQKYFAAQQRCLGILNGHIEEIYTGHTVVKAYNGEEASGRAFDEMNENLRQSGFKAQCLAGLMPPIMGFIGNLGYVAVCVVGGAMALSGRIGFGVIVAFMMYVRYFTQPLSQIAQSMQTMQSAAAAGERVFEFLQAEEMADESQKTKKLTDTKGAVEFSHVKFGYEDSDATVIHDFSASAKPGQKIAIVGPTGAGKTTMVNLLMRFYEIQGGEIRIDGVPIADLSRKEVHNQFCMVLQDTWLFEGTVRENLVYCTQNVSDEKITAACRAVGLDHFIRTLPHGYDTVLNDQTNLSQGQKQQLTIARAMIADKPILILDEATSSVDTRTEHQIQSAMDKLMENRTSFVIAHRLSTIKNSDLILVMKNGDIIESGTHDELLSQNGFYAELYNSQFEDRAS